MRATHVGVCVGLALLAPVQERVAEARVSCEGLSSLRLPNATVTSATEVAAGAFTPPTAPGRGVAPALAKTMASLQPFCRVAITSKPSRSEEHTSELQSRLHLVCRLLLEKKKKIKDYVKTD